MATRNTKEDELAAFGSADEFERYENDDIQGKFDEDREIEIGGDYCDGGCSNDGFVDGEGDACHEDSDCDGGSGDGVMTVMMEMAVMAVMLAMVVMAAMMEMAVMAVMMEMAGWQ